jgi:hypothetical protein
MTEILSFPLFIHDQLVNCLGLLNEPIDTLNFFIQNHPLSKKISRSYILFLLAGVYTLNFLFFWIWYLFFLLLFILFRIIYKIEIHFQFHRLQFFHLSNLVSIF